MKRKADGEMNRMKKRIKMKQKKRKGFQIEVRKQQELGNYYMVMITPNVNLFVTNQASCCYVCQVHVDTPESISNLSESTLKNIRQEGCFIRQMLPDGTTAQCVAVQDGYVFECPVKLLNHVGLQKEKNRKLTERTSRRCGCGVKDCDMNSLIVVNALNKMGIQTPK